MARYTEPGEYGPEHGLLPAGYQRASDADRDQVAEQLRAAFTDGRLTEPEFDARLSAALATVARDALPRLVRDLIPAEEPEPVIKYRDRTVTKPDWLARWAALALFEFTSFMPAIAWNGSMSVFWEYSPWMVVPCMATLTCALTMLMWWVRSI